VLSLAPTEAIKLWIADSAGPWVLACSRDEELGVSLAKLSGVYWVAAASSRFSRLSFTSDSLCFPGDSLFFTALISASTPWIIIDEMAESLIVKVSYGKRLLELQFSPSDTISVLKLRLEQETGISVPRQRLFLKGTHTLRPDKGRYSDPGRARPEACLSLSTGRDHRPRGGGGL